MNMSYWDFSARWYPVGRFVCAECGYDSMSKSEDRDTTRYDCLFCGWGCFRDYWGDWWNEETSRQRAEREFEEQMDYEQFLESLGR